MEKIPRKCFLNFTTEHLYYSSSERKLKSVSVFEPNKKILSNLMPGFFYYLIVIKLENTDNPMIPTKIANWNLNMSRNHLKKASDLQHSSNIWGRNGLKLRGRRVGGTSCMFRNGCGTLSFWGHQSSQRGTAGTRIAHIGGFWPEFVQSQLSFPSFDEVLWGCSKSLSIWIKTIIFGIP